MIEIGVAWRAMLHGQLMLKPAENPVTTRETFQTEASSTGAPQSS